MPRIPQIISREPLQTGNLSIGAAMQPGDAAARVGEQAANIGLELVQRQVELQRTRQVMEKTSQGAAAAANLYDQILNDPSVPDGQLATQVQKGFKILHDNIGSDIKDPQVRQTYDRNFEALTAQHVVEAIGVQRERIISGSKAALATSNDTLAGMAVDATGQQQDALIAQIHGNIAGAVANKQLTPEQGQKELAARLEQIDSAKTIKSIRENPARALSDLNSGLYPGLNPVRRQDLIDQAQSELFTQQKQILAQQEKDERDREKAFAQVRESAVSEMVSRARNGQLTLPELEDQRRKLDLNATQYDLVRNYIEKGPTRPSDPQKLLDYTIAVNSASAGAALETKLARDYSSGALERDDYWQLQTRLAENMKRSEETDGKTKARQAQAEQMLRADFGVTSPLDQITGASKNAYAMALEELTWRSAAFSGSEDPLAIEPQIRSKYAPIGLFATKQAIDRLRSGLPFKTIQQIGTREQARARGMSDAEYNSLVHRISELDAADGDLQRATGATNGTK